MKSSIYLKKTKKKFINLFLFRFKGCILYYKFIEHKIKKQLCSFSSPNNPRPGIIYMADGRCNPGGLCDRLHGILSLYKTSIELNMPFYINFTEPFVLSEYLSPNHIDWIIRKDEIASNKSQVNLLYVFCASGKYGYSLDKESEIQKKYICDKLSNKNLQYQVYSNAHFIDNSVEFARLFNELFIPNKYLVNAIKENQAKIKGKYIAIVLRFQNLLGDFEEGNSMPLDEQTQKKLINKLHHKILDIYKENGNIKVLVTSDSRKFLDTLSDIDFIYTIPGKIVHMSFTTNKDYETHLKSFIDLYMISLAEKIYLLVSDSMYKSGFAHFASMMNNKPYSEIVF